MHRIFLFLEYWQLQNVAFRQTGDWCITIQVTIRSVVIVLGKTKLALILVFALVSTALHLSCSSTGNSHVVTTSFSKLGLENRIMVQLFWQLMASFGAGQLRTGASLGWRMTTHTIVVSLKFTDWMGNNYTFTSWTNGGSQTLVLRVTSICHVRSHCYCKLRVITLLQRLRLLVLPNFNITIS
jgi:hypothetical protein